LSQQDLFSAPRPGESGKKKTPDRLSRKRRERLSRFEARLVERAADHDLSAAMVHYASELVRLQSDLDTVERNALVALVLASIIEQRNGSTRLPLALDDDGPLRGLFVQLLGGDAEQAAELTDAIGRVLRDDLAATIIGGPGDYRPLVVDADHIYHQRLLHCEDRLVDALQARLSLEPADLDADVVAAALSDVLEAMPTLADGSPMRLNAEQQYALLSAVFGPFTVISGGPGTGKTSIVVSLLRLLIRLGVDPGQVALAAPTGKAAHRLGESIDAQLADLDTPEYGVRHREKGAAAGSHGVRHHVEDGARHHVEDAGAGPDRALSRRLEQPRTLHRLLGYSPGSNTFYYHENNRLRQQVVIVDEASMIDLFLMERLISAVAPDARLILLGDAEQLPSVDAGAVFRDLVPERVDTRRPWRELAAVPVDATASDEPTAAHAARLSTSYRMDPTSPAGAAILQTAQSLNRGDARSLLDAEDALIEVRSRLEDVAGVGVELVEPADDGQRAAAETVSAFVEWWYREQVTALDDFRERILAPLAFDGEAFEESSRARLRALFSHFGGHRVLAITRVFATGAERLNAAFHARHQRLVGRAVDEDFALGEPIIMLQNDYGRGLFNGDRGLIVDVVRSVDGMRRVQPMAVFERGGRFVPFSLGPLRRHLEHAFALTVHKAQGSEFDHVAVVLPAENIPLLTREILYTGITRSRRSVLLVGRRERLSSAAQNPVRRFSGVAEKLGK
jgi:exodeoxyribonuclease V alpha subunit